MAGVATAAAGLLHVAVAIGGPSWYAFFGAPHRLLTCVGIASILLVFAAYAFWGSGVIPRLPLLKPVLGFVAAVFTLRGIAFVPMMLIAPSWMRRLTAHTQVDAFIIVTSLVCIALGAGYAASLRAM